MRASGRSKPAGGGSRGKENVGGSKHGWAQSEAGDRISEAFGEAQASTLQRQKQQMGVGRRLF